MDTPLHALAVPDADPATLKRPETAARELADAIAAALPHRLDGSRSQRARRHADDCRRPARPAAADAKLLVVDARRPHHARAAIAVRRFPAAGRSGDRERCGDAARQPARRARADRRRDRSAARGPVLAGSRSDVHAFSAVVFGAGDFHTRTEDRPLPPPLAPAIVLLGPARATRDCARRPSRRCSTIRGSCRCASTVRLDAVWAGLARHGRPIQYAHMTTPLALWDVWTPIAGAAGRVRAASASFALDWGSIRAMRERGIAFATITLAAGISSTGDPELDRRLPFDEPYRIPDSHGVRHPPGAGGRRPDRRDRHDGRARARARRRARRCRACGRRGREPAHRPGQPAACRRRHPLGHARTRTAATTSSCARSWTTPRWPRRMRRSRRDGYRTHEFGDSVLIEKSTRDTVTGMFRNLP